VPRRERDVRQLLLVVENVDDVTALVRLVKQRDSTNSGALVSMKNGFRAAMGFAIQDGVTIAWPFQFVNLLFIFQYQR